MRDTLRTSLLARPPHDHRAHSAQRGRIAPLFLLSCALVILFISVLLMGSVAIPLRDVLQILVGITHERSAWVTIIWDVRLPKALTALLAGAALGVSGLMMQTFFRNPLAGPFILGVSSGASLGVALIVLTTGAFGSVMIGGMLWLGAFSRAVAAGLGAALTMTIVLLVAHRIRQSMTLLILGLMFGYLTSALVSILLYFALPEQVQAYLRWTFGTFSATTWTQLSVFIPLVTIALVATLPLAKSLNALLLGEAYARSMGLDVRRLRWLLITLTAVLAGTVTAFCGAIGFIGIAVPHLCRSLFKSSDHRLLLPASILMGAIVGLGAVLIAELPHSQTVLPLNPITSLIGAPVVIWVIIRRQSAF